MSRRTISMTDSLHDYLLRETVREPAILARLREETAGLGRAAGMQISPEQGQLMALLVRLTGTRRMLEIGTFTGYSSLACLLAMPADGCMFCCDVSPEWTSVARRYWDEAGVADRVVLRLAPALESLQQLQDSGAAASFDMAFIDADKASYGAYFEVVLALLRPGGLMMFDNTLWSGHVADPDDQSEDTVALRRLNRSLADDPRVESSLIPIGDGLTLVWKKP